MRALLTREGLKWTPMEEAPKGKALMNDGPERATKGETSRVPLTDGSLTDVSLTDDSLIEGTLRLLIE
jgi:hypothetical protein